MARDLSRQIDGVRQVRWSEEVAGEWVHASGAEVLLSVEGEAAGSALRLERVKFASAAAAQAFLSNPRASQGPWAAELRGEWLVRVSGSALSDPELCARALASAWRRGPRAGERDALFVALEGGSYLVEDRVGLSAITGVVDRAFETASDASAQGLLPAGSQLSAEEYVSTSGQRYARFQRDGDLRRGLLGPIEASAQLDAYASRMFVRSSGASGALGRLFR